MNYEEVLNEKFCTPFTETERSLMKEAENLYKDNRLKDALLIYEELRESHPLSPSLLVITADLYLVFGRVDDAINSFNKAVELQPKSEKISRGLMHILWDQKKEMETVNEIQRFINTGEASKEYIDIALEINNKKDFNIMGIKGGGLD